MQCMYQVSQKWICRLLSQEKAFAGDDWRCMERRRHEQLTGDARVRIAAVEGRLQAQQAAHDQILSRFAQLESRLSLAESGASFSIDGEKGANGHSLASPDLIRKVSGRSRCLTFSPCSPTCVTFARRLRCT